MENELHSNGDARPQTPQELIIPGPDSKLNRLVDPEPARFLLPATGLWILVLDWVLFSQNSVSLGLATPLIAVLGFCVGGAGTWFLQRRYGRNRISVAAIKAFLGGLIVGTPLPLAGTVIGGWVLLASGLGNRGRRRSGKGSLGPS